MAVISMKALLESGVHFGHRTNKWDPRMKPYIFTERNGIHIIDLQQTVKLLNHAYNLIRDTVSTGGVDSVCRHETSGAGYREGRSGTLRHALRHGTLAGRHAYELVHHVCTYPGVGIAWSSCVTRARSAASPRRKACSFNEKLTACSFAYRAFGR